jgi:hypothetical protein
MGPLAFRAFLLAGGWLKLPLACAALGALRSVFTARSPRIRLLAAVTSVVLAALGLALVVVPLPSVERTPGTPLAKSRAMLRWSYESPAAVLRIVRMSHDRDPRVREMAMLAMGDNVVVTRLEKPPRDPPAGRDERAVGDSLAARLVEVMASDSVEGVRAEAARALWRSPRAFGERSAAAETLAAMLDRAGRPGALERSSWLALDAAAGHRHPTLEAAVARFAATTPDTELARVARLALERSRGAGVRATDPGRAGAASGIRDP